MALVTCPDCGKNVSSKAEACPNCGYPISVTRKKPQTGRRTPNVGAGFGTLGRWSLLGLFLGTLILFFFIILTLMDHSYPSREQLPTSTKRSSKLTTRPTLHPTPYPTRPTRRPTPYPTYSYAAVGSVAELHDSSKKNVLVAISSEALDDLCKTMRAKDKVGLKLLYLEGKIFLVSDGIRCRVLERTFSYAQVRLEEGDDIGRAVWVLKKWVTAP